MSKAFTNQEASDVVVRELAIVTGLASGNSDFNDAVGQGYSMVRDTLDSPLTIPTGRTLTVDYELVVRLSPDTLDTDIDGTNGGFVQSLWNPFVRARSGVLATRFGCLWPGAWA